MKKERENSIPDNASIKAMQTHGLPLDNDDLFLLDQFALFDYDQALENCGSHTMLVELLQLMIREQIPVDLEEMKKAFAEKNHHQVEKIAHKIKGGAVYVGTVKMKYACQYLERYWKTGQKEFYTILYAQALRAIEDTCVHIGRWLKEQNRS